MSKIKNNSWSSLVNFISDASDCLLYTSSVADVKHIVVKTNLASEAFTMLSKAKAALDFILSDVALPDPFYVLYPLAKVLHAKIDALIFKL